jgi:hypothetical protein
MRDLWEVYERFMGDPWEIHGRYTGDNIREIRPIRAVTLIRAHPIPQASCGINGSGERPCGCAEEFLKDEKVVAPALCTLVASSK